MTEPRIDEVAGTFEIHRAEVAEFCKYLTTRGIHCDPGVSNTGANWIEAPGASVQQSDIVSLRPLHRERLREIKELYQTWRRGEGV
jgi:hypothetical protein